MSLYSCVPVVSSACTASRLPSCGGPLQAETPGHRGQETRPEGVPGPGGVDWSDVLDGSDEHRRLASPVDPCALRAERCDPDAYLSDQLGRAPAGLVLGQRCLVVVAEQVSGAGYELA